MKTSQDLRLKANNTGIHRDQTYRIEIEGISDLSDFLFLPAALPTGLRMIGVVLLLLVVLGYYFQKTPKRCPISTKLSGMHLRAKRSPCDCESLCNPP